MEKIYLIYETMRENGKIDNYMLGCASFVDCFLTDCVGDRLTDCSRGSVFKYLVETLNCESESFKESFQNITLIYTIIDAETYGVVHEMAYNVDRDEMKSPVGQRFPDAARGFSDKLRSLLEQKALRECVGETGGSYGGRATRI